MSEGNGRRQFVLRVHIDDIHNIDTSLRTQFQNMPFLRLAVVLDQDALIPCIAARELDCGELDFDKLIFIFVKEQIKYLFFNLYIAQPPDMEPEVLATGRLAMSELTSNGSLWTIPLSSNDRDVCEVTFCIHQLPLLVQSDDTEYYPPAFTSAIDEVALGVRKITAPASAFCHAVAMELFLTPVRTGSIITRLLCKVLRRLLS